MKLRSRLSSLRIRISLIIFGVALGLLARWVFGVDSGNNTSVFEPIPTDIRQQFSEPDLEQLLDEEIPSFD